MKHQPEVGDFSHSLTDLMAGVAAIFLLIAVVFILMAAKRAEKAALDSKHSSEQIAELDRFRSSVLHSLDALGQEIETDHALATFVTIDKEARKKDPFLFVVVFNQDELLFKSSTCSLNSSQLAIIQQAAPRLLAHVCNFAKAMDSEGKTQRTVISMTLEGHTDRLSFLPRSTGCGVDSTDCAWNDTSARCARIGFENNVRLSAARAQNVFFAMQTAVNQDQNISGCLERYFVVAGRGPVEPVDGNANWRAPRDDSLAERNRRVILKIRAQPVIETASAR